MELRREGDPHFTTMALYPPSVTLIARAVSIT
jgi:hypothetical protein